MCKLFLVAGRVQGVFFRASTRDEALSLRLSGYAKNLPDGRVEVVACGAQAAVEKLHHWLHKGPRLADVTSIDVREIECRNPAGFTVS